MATQYSNKPIVTDGLVYALDFGNPKSYVSGSTTAQSLKFFLPTASVVGNPTYDELEGLLNLGDNQNVLINKTFPELVINKSYTVCTLVKVDSYGVFYNQDTSPSDVSSGLDPNYTSAGHLVVSSAYLQGSDFRRKYPADLTELTHITYRCISGSLDVFINGAPVNTTGDIGNMLRGSGLNLSGRDNSNTFWSGSIGNFYIYNRALNSDEIYQNYLLTAQRYGLPTTPKPYTVDENAHLFLETAGITDPIITSSIDTFVRGLKENNLWHKMAVIYPFVGTGSEGINLTGSQRINLKEPGIYNLSYNGAWEGSTSGSAPSGSGTYISPGVTPKSSFPFYVANNYHMSILSYDTPVSSSYLMGTGMTEELAVSTLAGDYGTPAAAYSVRKVRTAYSGALMDVRRSYDNVTASIGYVESGDLDTGSLLDWTIPGRNNLPGEYEGLAAAYSLRKVSASYDGFAVEVRRDWDNESGSFGFNVNGELDTVSLLTFVTGSAGTGSGFVQTWYDQSGNNRHATQTTSSRQPLIVSSGSLVTENGKPALSFDGVDDRLVIVDSKTNFKFLHDGTNHTIIAVNKKNTTTQKAIIGNNGGTGANVGFYIDSDTAFTHVVSNGGNNIVINTTTTPVSNNQQYFNFILSDPANATANLRSLIYINSSSVNQNNVRTFSPSSNPSTFDLEIGGYGNNVGNMDGNIQEIVMYTSSQAASRPLIENNINNYYNIYTGSNHGFVERWYDQSGNNRHAVQTLTGSQPIIVESGSIMTENSRSTIQWDGNDDFLSTTLSISQPDTMFIVSRMITTGSAKHFIDATSGTNRQIASPSLGYYSSFAGSSLDSLISVDLTKMQLSSYLFNSTNSFISVNGVLVTGSVGTNSLTSMQIGKGQNTTSIDGKLSEIVIYPSNQSSNREPIEYNINNYYNIYPQTSSFATSSFTIKADPTSISGSINNKLSSGIASSGPLGLITVSRTGSNSLTLARNGAVTSFNTPASGALSSGIYLGAINNNGLALGNSPLNISFASVGTGLTNSDIINLNENVGLLNINLGRGGVLNTYDALAAYSLRLLDYGYTGPAVTVRRTSDNTTSSIGFDSNGDLDITSLLTFTGTSSAYVTTWYDQSGNNKHISQAVTGSQPLLVRSGSVLTPRTLHSFGNNNTKPAIYFNGAFLDLGTSIGSITQASYYLVYNLSQNGATPYSVFQTNTTTATDRWQFGVGGSNAGTDGYINVFSPDRSSRRSSYPATVSVGGTTLWSAYHGPGTNMRVFLQGNIDKGTNTQLAFSSGSMFRVGRGTSAILPGSIQELIVYPDALTSRKNFLENNINNYYQIY